VNASLFRRFSWEESPCLSLHPLQDPDNPGSVLAFFGGMLIVRCGMVTYV
jgi:hypothetical protein